jgi:hypothetical protein
MEAYESCMDNLYQGRAKFTECLPTREWARIGAFSDGTGAGVIPIHQLKAFNQRIHDAGLKTQRKFHKRQFILEV